MRKLKLVSRKTSSLSAERRRYLEELAEAVLEDCDVAAPVSPEAILDAYRITLSANDYLDAFDGMLEYRNGSFHVYCNVGRVGRLGSTRGRFTLAHELGHFSIDDHRQALEAGVSPHQSLTNFRSRELIEQEADLFASCLLMPATDYRKRAAVTGLQSILKTARHFNTSVTSSAIRHAVLEIEPCAIVRWNSNGKTWKWLSESTRQAKFWGMELSRERVARDSATGRALAGQDPGKAEYFESGTTAAAWFPWMDHESSRNVIMIEQAMQLGRYGVVTVIRPESRSFRF